MSCPVARQGDGGGGKNSWELALKGFWQLQHQVLGESRQDKTKLFYLLNFRKYESASPCWLQPNWMTVAWRISEEPVKAFYGGETRGIDQFGVDLRGLDVGMSQELGDDVDLVALGGEERGETVSGDMEGDVLLDACCLRPHYEVSRDDGT